MGTDRQIKAVCRKKRASFLIFNRKKYDLPFAYDLNSTTLKSFGFNSNPSSIIIDQNFVIRHKQIGVKNITVLHAKNRHVADSDSFVAPLLNAKGVWFGGGRQWRLVDAYKDTKTEKMFREVLKKGGVIGGSSSGATIQGSYLARGDTKNNQIMTGDHEEGFGYIQNIAIDQHALARNRQFDMFDILKKRPELLGISIDEKTAIIVKGSIFEVIGQSYVIVYDGSFWSREGWDKKNLPAKDNLFYFLREGDKYDMLKREVTEN